jgi:ribonuclease PH
MIRKGNRAFDAVRNVRIKTGFIKYAEGSCLIEVGNTKVICTASLEDGVPLFLRGRCRGWVTAEYAMLPRSCNKRVQRESSKGRVGGRTHEIQRLIGRSLRSVVDMELLGERTIFIDCDVIQADGGTRTASITGSFVALACCFKSMIGRGILEKSPIRDHVAAVSVGIMDNHILLDLDYEEDSNADVDMNVVMTGAGDFIEVQGTAEGRQFNDRQMRGMISFAKKGVKEFVLKQRKVLKD